MKRREAREYAFQLIYELGVQGEKSTDELIADTAAEQEYKPDKYITETVKGVKEHLAEIDEIVSEYSLKWKLQRLSGATHAIMRLGVYEMLYTDVPFSVAINEAVEIAKKYDHDKAPKFINGILNAVAESKGLKSARAQGEEEK